MGLTYSAWTKRISKRSDITGMLTHLTKPVHNDLKGLSDSEINKLSIDNLINILKDQKINGSTTSRGFITGDIPAVCFQDAPLYGIIQNVEFEKEMREVRESSKLRYSGIGLTFGKPYIYAKGGRPVIYEDTVSAKSFLPSNQYWRIVRFNIDFINGSQTHVDRTHEREWRAPHSIEFDLKLCHIVLYDKECLDYFNKTCPEEIKDTIHGITILKSILM
ncbi:hypothetical protein JMA_26770 [Jeotgalibacillus malaysiensis]|uniref:DUF2971 domain-containing protein n=1 Tax=Jeotgalibacillus malaysiensis TaxID=1508404 RepID=A0A0B5AVG9_9BACL|nr:hypothetical protein [Jeotgalibacillus malaysiensis]AJD91994.1 hypothetical protein JMA_26770 [Jeotgalibacillus malaysiensis]